MPRQARLVLDNVCYHVICRGSQRQCIFDEMADFQKYLKLLSKYKEKYGFKLYGWCLMSNHIHMVFRRLKRHLGSDPK